MGDGFRVTLLADRWVLDSVGPASGYRFAELKQSLAEINTQEATLLKLLRRIDADDAPPFLPVDVLLQRVVNWRLSPPKTPDHHDTDEMDAAPLPTEAIAALARRALTPDQQSELDGLREEHTCTPRMQGTLDVDSAPLPSSRP